MISEFEVKNWPTLYKVDNKGKIRQWSINAKCRKDGCSYEQEHGVQNGKLQRTHTTIQEGKNKGKSNETNEWQQCCLEAESLWTKQRDRKGYTEEIPSEKPFGPMLAKSYDKDGKHIKFPCYVQPKLDGLRCIARVENGKVTLHSRQNKQFKVLQHIEKELLEHWPDGIYDGELYCHKETFQTIVGAIKRDEKNEFTEKIGYHIYDVVNDQPYEQRKSIIDRVMGPKPFHLKDTWGVTTQHVYKDSELEELHKKWTEFGYEGIMLRNKDGLYKINGRSADLQKYKKFMDEEFEIIGADECVGKMEGFCTFRCKTKAGAEFNVMPEGTESQRREYWDKWLNGDIEEGSKLSVRFFSWTTGDKPVPRFPIGVAIRDYE